MQHNLSHPLRFRQVHLDFHTAGEIPQVGAKFDQDAFQAALRDGCVDSITLFAKCHHGYSYYSTEVGVIHPTLKRDLLAEQIEACRSVGVRCPIYISAGFDEVSAFAHPEWVIVGKDGQLRNMLETPGWSQLNFATAYLDYLCAQIEEVVCRWPDNDGIFLDIVCPWRDYSRATLKRMRAAGLDPRHDEDANLNAQNVLLNYYRRANAAVRSVRADTAVFHNGGHLPIGASRFNFLNSHFELESLPTGGWGYDHFQFSARYAVTQPREFLGMTGKFHGTWGEFGGFKRPAALRYECSSMLANGAKCSVGDQLHPSGEINSDTYALIGAAYAEVKAKEPWVRNVSPAACIALISAESPQHEVRDTTTISAADQGAARMLLELHLPFVVLDAQADWSGYHLVVLPDGFRFTSDTLAKAREHLAARRCILAAGSALLNSSGDAFALDPGAELIGRSDFDPDYLLATPLSQDVPVRSPIMIPGGAYEVSLTTGRALAERRVPYFNRDWRHFCSHQHAPDSPASVGPAAVLGRSVAWFAHDLFAQYRSIGQPLYRDFFLAALKHLFPEGLPVETSLPSVARFNLLEQPTESRHIAHLLYAPVTLRASLMIWGQPKPCEVIEELIPLLDSRVTLFLQLKVRAVTLEPQGIELSFTQNNNRLTFIVPSFTGHQMVALHHCK